MSIITQFWHNQNVFGMHLLSPIGSWTSRILRYISSENNGTTIPGSASIIHPELVIISCFPCTTLVLACHLQVNQQVNYASEPAKGARDCCCVVHG